MSELATSGFRMFMGNEQDGVRERSFFAVAVGLRVRQVRARVLGDCRSSVGLVVMQSGSYFLHRLLMDSHERWFGCICM